MRKLLKLLLLKILSPSGIWYRVLPTSLVRMLDAISTPPAGDAYYGERAASYDSARSDQDWWYEEQAGVRKVLYGLAGVKRVLDVPVGTGRFFSFYKDCNLKVSGIDLSDDMISLASEKAKGLDLEVHLERANAIHMPFDDKTFDLVVCFRFLQSIITIRDARKVISEISRVSRRYAIIELDFCEPGDRKNFDPPVYATMRNRFTYDEVVAMLRDADLEVIDLAGPFRKASSSQYAFVCEKRA